MTNVEQQICSIIARILEVEADEVDTDLVIGDLPEWDSLHHLRIIVEIETSFGIKFKPEDLIELEDVADLVSLTEELL